MTDHLSIGPTPASEKCEQLGTGYDSAKARAECNRFIAAICKYFGNPPPGASLHVHANPHDFGTYLEVCVRYDDSSEEAETYAFNVEGNCPETWAEMESGAKFTG